MIAKNCEGRVPSPGDLDPADRAILAQADAALASARTAMADQATHHALAAIFAVVSEEEAAKAKADKNFKEEQLVVRGDRRLLQTAEIRGLDLVIQFDQFAKVLQARRDAAVQLTELLKRAEKDEEKARIQTQLDQTLELLNKGNKEMAESVGYSITHNYEVEVLESKFVILLNQEEVNQVQGLIANAQQQAAAAPAAVASAEAPKLEKKAEKKN
jgi:methionyl-tRNA synthetase